MKTNFDNIQFMRGLGALTVLFAHIYMFENGMFGVELFFLICGFIIMHATQNNTRHFLLKRAIRIIPLYWLVTFMTTALLVFMPNFFRTIVFSPELLVKSLFFIPFFCVGESGATINSLVQVGWTLVIEVFFYILFFAATKINKNARHIITSALIIVMVLIGQIFKNSGSTFIRFYCQPFILEFMIGMLSYRLLIPKSSSTPRKTPSVTARIILISAGSLIWLSLFAVKYIHALDNVDRVIKYGIPAFAVFVLFFKGLENCKIPRPFVVLGNISYSLYLTHYFVIQGFSRLIYNIDNFSVIGMVLVFFAVIPLSIAVAWISWWIIEYKFTGLLKRKLLKNSR